MDIKMDKIIITVRGYSELGKTKAILTMIDALEKKGVKCCATSEEDISIMGKGYLEKLIEKYNIVFIDEEHKLI